ncbi:ABC transporter permease [Blastococcus sp. PRF04-17]|uniref:ABC transporter permease n=1 Tax=Blastococcus sp. PRF04-17 TaxID=2933797 RepID=UPI001FF54BE1|nr:ABC transporter permease [Blastococcus sp. PRF04-17]UOY02083.1 ABC transporter permease [Blastococcus sp. PRF04-17]
MTGVLGAFAEAWGEVRVHKSRVVLSLVGVFLAVFAMTSVTALGQLMAQAQQEQSERWGGRAATIGIQAFDPMTGAAPAKEKWDAAVAGLIERYGITGASSVAWSEGLYRLPEGPMAVQTRTVSPSYGPLHRVEPVQGRWFREGDRTSLAPALVVNERFLARLGIGDLSSPATVMIGGPRPVLAAIVGVVREGYEEELIVYRAEGSGGVWESEADASQQVMYGPPTLELWVPPEQAEQVIETVQHDLRLALPGTDVQAYRQDDPMLAESLATLRLAIRGAGIVVLILGGLGVLNIGLVTVRQRIREIGVRRSFGAGSGRIFSAVMLESVCATAVAGVAAVAASIVLVRLLPLESLVNQGIPFADRPGFPVAAAVEGMVAATGVGALAGLLPAIIAVRAKVIDAIRF